MFWVSLANTKLVLAATSVCGDPLVKAAAVNGLPGTRWAEPFACKLNARTGCSVSLPPSYTKATVGELVVWAKLVLTPINSNVRRIRIVRIGSLSPGMAVVSGTVADS
jgi:hypothetical protein